MLANTSVSAGNRLGRNACAHSIAADNRNAPVATTAVRGSSFHERRRPSWCTRTPNGMNRTRFRLKSPPRYLPNWSNSPARGLAASVKSNGASVTAAMQTSQTIASRTLTETRKGRFLWRHTNEGWTRASVAPGVRRTFLAECQYRPMAVETASGRSSSSLTTRGFRSAVRETSDRSAHEGA